MNELSPPNPPSAAAPRLSYKFQRLAEKIRQAIQSGELSGKLPGERILARRFNANAKTLSKALTDLAAEGLLERSIGRGTYVKGTQPAAAAEQARWLIIADAAQADSPLVGQLMTLNAEAQVISDTSSLRPSFINQFGAVIDMAAGTNEAFLRDLIVRNIPVVAVGHEPQMYSTNAVLVDRTQALMALARDLMLAGHRRFAAVESRGSRVASDALRAAASRYASDATIDSCTANEVAAMLDHQVSAVVCESVETAQQVRQVFNLVGIAVPGRLSLAAVGCAGSNPVCSGYFVDVAPMADAVCQLLNDTQSRRPATLWLVGTKVDAGTIGAGGGTPEEPRYRITAAAV